MSNLDVPILPVSQVQNSTTNDHWHDEDGVIETFSLHPHVEKFFQIALAKRIISQTCCCFSNPITGVFWTLLPCWMGPVNECCSAHSTFMQRNAHRQVALTEKGITIKTLKALNKKQRRYLYQDAPTAKAHHPSLGIHALDQFALDREWETAEQDSIYGTGPTANNYDVRRLYYDQIRSATVIDRNDPQSGYHTNCMCFCCCGFEHADSRIKFVRIDIGRDSHVAENREDLSMMNPILVGLADAHRFCQEVNIRARGGKALNHGETKIVDVLSAVACVAAAASPPIMSRLVANGNSDAPLVPIVPIVPTMSEDGGGQKTEPMLSLELNNLAELFRTGGLTEQEFQSAKDACIKRYS